ncbi:MAG: squalene/phytoene synthase family protein [Caulobacteraceae bacterium]
MRAPRRSACAAPSTAAKSSPSTASTWEAFRRDVTKTRYADWDALMDYCRYSAAPVGRFVLDVHGESRALWPANDALCSALQVINHLQDCAEDYRDLDRVYIPTGELKRAGTSVEALGADRASPELRRVITGLARGTGGLLDRSRPFAAGIKDGRLAYEVALIQRLAESLTARLIRFDPLSERVHNRPIEIAGTGAPRPGRPPGRPRPRRGEAGLRGAGGEWHERRRRDRAGQGQGVRQFLLCGMRVLPKAEREAMFAIYAFCRAVGRYRRRHAGRPAPAPPGARRLARRHRKPLCRRRLGPRPHRRRGGGALRPGEGRFPHCHRRHADGRGTPTSAPPTWRRSTSTATAWRRRWGGCRFASSAWTAIRGLRLAYHLGRALQLTNILRDLDEDAAIGRLYLPRELLEAASVDTADPEIAIADPRVDGVCRELAKVAHQHYAAAAKVLAARPAGRLAAPRLMGAVYSRILSKTEADGWAPPRRRAKLGKGELLWIVLRRGAAGLSPSRVPAKVHVIGGGLAGLSAAVALAGRGVRWS